jgi:hypothetical protein
MQDSPNIQPQQPPPFTVNGKPLTCGLRFSVVDAVTLIVGASVTVWMWSRDPKFALIVPFTLAHFFLFCNVFRGTRGPELIWATVFLVNITAWNANGGINWPAICAIQLPLTAFLLWRETTKPWYHGIACRKWNAEHVDAYLRGERKPGYKATTHTTSNS